MITFVTTNKFKAIELKEKLEMYNIKIKVLIDTKVEIQSNDLQSIAEASVQQLCTKLKTPVLVEDSGLFIEELKGFPGPYSSYVYRKLGLKGILKLMEDRSNRNAEFQSVIALKTPSRPPLSFKGKCRGTISEEVEGTGGFGFDPIFIPREGGGRTFAEMSLDEKNDYSHRSKAVRTFAKWFNSQTTLK